MGPIKNADDVLRIASVWKQSVRDATRFFAKTKEAQVLIVPYEDLVGEPERMVRAVCSFLDVPNETGMLKMSYSNSAFQEVRDAAGSGIYKDRSEAATVPGLAPEWVNRLEAFLRPELQCLGYMESNVHSPGRSMAFLAGAENRAWTRQQAHVAGRIAIARSGLASLIRGSLGLDANQ